MEGKDQEMDQTVEEIARPISESTLDSTLDTNTEEVILTISSGQDSEIIFSSNYDIVECIVEDEGEFVFPFADQAIIGDPENPTTGEAISLRNDRVNTVPNSLDDELLTLLSEMKAQYNEDTPAIECFPENPRRSENEKYIVFCDTEDENRVGSVYWCQCGNCIPMRTNIESVCCKEIQNAEPLMENLNCITEHELFNFFCQRVETVTVNVYSFVYLHKEPADKDMNRCRRKTAYRSFTGWIHGYLGAGNRKPIPSCAVASVRRSFPDPDLQYLGFKPQRDNAAEFMAFE